jgi:hypothetical protein
MEFSAIGEKEKAHHGNHNQRTGSGTKIKEKKKIAFDFEALRQSHGTTKDLT